MKFGEVLLSHACVLAGCWTEEKSPELSLPLALEGFKETSLSHSLKEDFFAPLMI